MKALSSTGYLKTLITASSPIDVEAKNKQSELITLYTRVIWFGNGSLKALHDHSEGFSRRFIIIRVKPKPKDRIDDPHLTEKILFEKDEIFRWMLQGLQRLIANDFKFTISERTRQTIETAIADNCNIIEFLKGQERVEFNDGYSESTAELYKEYTDWCEKNSLTSIQRDDTVSWLKTNAQRYGLIFSNHIRNSQGHEVRGFKGIRCISRKI